MKLFSLAFLAGILCLLQFSKLPPFNWIMIISPIVLILIFYFRRYAIISLIIAFLLGFSWCLYYSHQQLDWSLPSELEGKNISITGSIASLPACAYHRCSFLFYTNTLENNQPVNHLFKLSWIQEGSQLKVGDQWRLTTRLKRIHSSMNPQGFDYEAKAFQEKIRATGYVVNHTKAELLNSAWYHDPLDRFRQFLQQKIETALPKSNTSPWIEALIIGERQNIPASSWEVLRNTGTNHLMAIAGLHIGFMAALAHKITSYCWSRLAALTLFLPAQQAGAIAALAMALIYSALAGFSIPTQRACIMLTIFLAAVLLRRKIISWQAWSIALLFVLLMNPLDVLTESFWLSFVSVALIIYGMSGRLLTSNVWWKWGRVQWVIAVGLIPLGIGLFHQMSLVGFVANSISIPLVGFIIVPLCLIGTAALLISTHLGGLVLTLADQLLNWTWIILSYLSHLSWASWNIVMPNTMILITSCIAAVIFLLPRGFPGKCLALIWVLPLIFYQPSSPTLGEARLILLDVGQGLSAIVQTQHHVLVFDAGPRLNENADMGENVVAPFLYSLKTRKIDRLVISHGDNDHIGGALALLKHFPVTTISSSVPDDLASATAHYCLRGESWEWDQVRFDFLYPTQENLDLNNDSSCVLRVSAGNNHILLTGDIEKSAEADLVNSVQDQLYSQILVAPHHGSKTSAQDDFLAAVKPQYVFYATGYRNRYHFPNASVVEKYTALGTQQFDTASSGAIRVSISPYEIGPVSLYRHVQHRYWNL